MNNKLILSIFLFFTNLLANAAGGNISTIIVKSNYEDEQLLSMNSYKVSIAGKQLSVLKDVDPTKNVMLISGIHQSGRQTLREKCTVAIKNETAGCSLIIDVPKAHDKYCLLVFLGEAGKFPVHAELRVQNEDGRCISYS